MKRALLTLGFLVAATSLQANGNTVTCSVSATWCIIKTSGGLWRGWGWGTAFPSGNDSNGAAFTAPVAGDRFERTDEHKSYYWTGSAWTQYLDYTIPPSTGGVSDGDKGSLTVSAGGTVWTIDGDAVAYSQIQNVSATDKCLGRVTAAAGDIEEFACTAAGRALLDDATAADQRTTLGLGTLSTQSGTFSGTSSGTNTGDQTITLTGNVTGTGTGSFAATIANDAVTYAQIQNVSATDKCLGRSTAGAGDVEEIACTAAGRALIDDATAADQRTTLGLGTLATQSGTFSGTSSGTNTGDQTITLTGNVTGSGTGSFAATIANNAVTNALAAQMAANTVKGNNTGSTANAADLTVAQTLTLLGAFSGHAIQAQTSTSAYTPTAGMKYVLVITTGGGGGGGGADASAAANGGAGGGGGAGGTTISVFTAATIGASQTCTVGAGGTAGSGTNGTNGGAGTNTTFGALDTGVGGALGTGSGNSAIRTQSVAGGAGGVSNNGVVNLIGGDGDSSRMFINLDATDTNETAIAQGGRGGASFWGGGGRGGANAQDAAAADSTAGSQAGNAGTAPGSGGGGGAVLNTATGVAGGVGANGICVEIEFF